MRYVDGRDASVRRFRQDGCHLARRSSSRHDDDERRSTIQGCAGGKAGGPRPAAGVEGRVVIDQVHGGAPVYVAPVHVAPIHVAPIHVAPVHVAPAHVAPACDGGHGWSSQAITIESVGRQRNLLSGLRQGVLVTRRDLTIVWCNPSWNAKLQPGPDRFEPGASAAPMIDRLAELGEYGPGPADRHATFRKIATQEGLTFQLRRTSGRSARELIVAGAPIGDDGYITTLTDLDVAATAEEGRLEALVQQRTHALSAENAALHALAMLDPLLGIANRRRFDELVVSECARSDRTACIAIIDVDHFKSINDRYGHPAGDALLRGLAASTSGALRPGDHLARYGGEEFVLLMPGTVLDEGREMAERVRRAAAATVTMLDGAALTATVSVGVSAWQPSRMPIEAAIASADIALYRAKAEGRNRVVSAAPG